MGQSYFGLENLQSFILDGKRRAQQYQQSLCTINTHSFHLTKSTSNAPDPSNLASVDSLLTFFPPAGAKVGDILLSYLEPSQGDYSEKIRQLRIPLSKNICGRAKDREKRTGKIVWGKELLIPEDFLLAQSLCIKSSRGSSHEAADHTLDHGPCGRK
jgi:hypothetical protein